MNDVNIPKIKCESIDSYNSNIKYIQMQFTKNETNSQSWQEHIRVQKFILDTTNLLLITAHSEY